LAWVGLTNLFYFQKVADDVLLNLIELAIYSGIFVIATTKKKFTINLDQKDWPIYLTWPGALTLGGVTLKTGDNASGAATAAEPSTKKKK